MGGCEQRREEGGRLHTLLKAKSAISPHGTTPGYPDAFQSVGNKVRRSIWKGTAAVDRDFGA